MNDGHRIDDQDRYICEPGKPMPKNAPGVWVHVQGQEILNPDDTIRVECEICGFTWLVEEAKEEESEEQTETE